VTHAATIGERDAVSNGVSHATPVPEGYGTANHHHQVADAQARDDDDSRFSELIPGNHRAIDAAISSEVRRLTGTALDAEAVADIRAEILGGRQVAEPAAYAVRAIRAEAEADPRLGRWLPGEPAAPATSSRARAPGKPGGHAPATVVLGNARNPAGDTDPARRADPDTAHRGAAQARRLLAEKAAAKTPRPVADIELPEPDPLERIRLEPLEPGETEYDAAEAEPEPDDDECPF
jgi:hypothetical protein